MKRIQNIGEEVNSGEEVWLVNVAHALDESISSYQDGLLIIHEVYGMK